MKIEIEDINEDEQMKWIEQQRDHWMEAAKMAQKAKNFELFAFALDRKDEFDLWLKGIRRMRGQELEFFKSENGRRNAVQEEYERKYSVDLSQFRYKE